MPRSPRTHTKKRRRRLCTESDFRRCLSSNKVCPYCGRSANAIKKTCECVCVEKKENCVCVSNSRRCVLCSMLAHRYAEAESIWCLKLYRLSVHKKRKFICIFSLCFLLFSCTHRRSLFVGFFWSVVAVAVTIFASSYSFQKLFCLTIRHGSRCRICRCIFRWIVKPYA